MRRFYYLIIATATAMLMSIAANSQQVVNENFESYDAGSYMSTVAAPQWEMWGTGVLGGLVSEEQAHNGTKSMKAYINGNTETDVILNMNDLTTGRYRVEFYMYVPANQTGYYNILQDFNGQNSQWGIQLTFNGGTITIDANGSQYTHPYTPDSWTKIQHFVDLDNDWIDFYLNDEVVLSYQWSKGTNGDGTTCKLDAIDFYSHTANNQAGLYYIDDLVIEQVPAPAAPTNLTATVQNENDVVLSWTAVDNNDLVYYSISREGEEVATTTETTYTDEHLYPMTYNYQVRAYCGTAIGYSAASNTAQAVIEGGVERQNVLVEVFSYRGCGYCPYAAKALDNMEATGNYDIIVLDQHISDTYGYTESANRFQYWAGKDNMYGQNYGFDGTPSMVFDGYIGMAGLYSTTISEEQQYITTFYNYVKDINSIYNLNAELVQTEVGSKTFTLNVTAEKLSEYFGNDQIVVMAALAEDINYNWGVAGKINNLVRVMYPNANGTVATFDGNNQFSTSYTITVSDDYDITKCKVVVWVENHTQGRVMQSKRFMVSDYYVVDVAEENVVNSIYPNPSEGMFNISGENIESIEVYDITGKLVMQQQVNANNTTIDLTNKAKGVYTLKSYNGNNVSVSKLIVE
ncbi:MAG: T9SS type A sorting domain-containing protein [Bacteroidales bacterium]|nr:T9SS type A sorting domain-containing protein [Bacteroidales bacterium]